MAKSIKLNLFYNTLLNISGVLFPLVTAPYVSRVLEPDGIGLFNFANTYAGYFALFAALGIPMYAVREVAKVRDDKATLSQLTSEIISLSALTTIICTLLYIASLFIIPKMYESITFFLMAGLVLYFVPLKIDWFFSGCEEFGHITLRSLVIRFLSIILLFTLVKEKGDLLIYIALNALSTVVSIIWNFSKLHKTGVKIKWTWTGVRHLKPLLILFSSSIAISIYTILDTLMIGFMTSYEEVGYYNTATHISKSLLPIATSLAAVAMPRLSYYLKNGKSDEINTLMNKSLSIVSFLSFPIAFGIIAIAPTFVPLFFGELYYGSIIPLQIIILVVIAIGLNNLLGVQVLVGLGHDKLFLYAVLVGTSSNFICNILLIPQYGASGAAFSSVLAETLILLYEIYLVKKYTTIRFKNFKEIFICFVLSLCFFPIFYFIDPLFEGWIKVGVFVICGGVFYIVMQYVFKNTSVNIFVGLLKSKLNLK